ncbi:MAG: hypothetical protein HY874_11085 [Chloroflexi bacterium]|nr:hypothetical protein [Chloroflexota bacterium]
MKASVIGRFGYALRWFLATVDRIGGFHQRNRVAGLVIVGSVLIGPIAASIVAIAFGLVTLIVPAAILTAVLVSVLILEGAYAENEALRNMSRSGIAMQAYASVARTIATNRSRLDTWSPTGTEWFSHLERPLIAVRFVEPRGPIVYPTDAPRQFDLPIGLKERWECFVHDLPRPRLVVQQFQDNRVEIEAMNYERKRLILELYYAPETPKSAAVQVDTSAERDT